MTRIVLELPDSLARKAEEAGVLDAEVVAGLLENELQRRRAADSFSAALEKLHSAQDSSLQTEEEVRHYVNEVIAEVRTKERAKRNAVSP